MALFQEFKKFIARGNVMDLAVGIIIGTAFTGIVNSLVNDVIMPPIGVVLGGMDFSNFFLTLTKHGDYATLKAAQEAGASTINYGKFINTVINFLIVAFAVFMLVKQVNRLKDRLMKAEAEAAPAAAPTPSEALLTEIRDLLRQQKS